jgi:hypothetical protein
VFNANKRNLHDTPPASFIDLQELRLKNALCDVLYGNEQNTGRRVLDPCKYKIFTRGLIMKVINCEQNYSLRVAALKIFKEYGFEEETNELTGLITKRRIHYG